MTTIPLPWTAPPLTKNRVRRMHHHAEAKARKDIVDVVALLARDIKPMPGAVIILHWVMPDRRRRDGDGAAPTLAACIDGIVKAGVLTDDSWVEVPHSGVTCHAPTPGQPGRLWLTLTDPDVTESVVVWPKEGK